MVPYSESSSEETQCIEVNISPYSCNLEHYKRIAFENEYESIFFQPFLFANIPAESPSYAPTFFGM